MLIKNYEEHFNKNQRQMLCWLRWQPYDDDDDDDKDDDDDDDDENNK